MSKTKVGKLIVAFRGIPVMNEILNILEKKQFAIVKEEKGAAETIVGVLSPLERAMFTFLEGTESDFNARIDAIVTGKDDGCSGLRVRCTKMIARDIDHCPYGTEIKEFMTTHPLVMHMDFVQKVKNVLVNSRIPDAEKMVANFFVVSTTPSAENPDYEHFSGWEDMSLEELMAISIKGTALEEVADILEVGEFSCSNDEVVAEGEVVVRGMTDFEKAINTYVYRLKQQLEPLTAEAQAIQEGPNYEKSMRPKIDVDEVLRGFVTMISIMMGEMEPTYREKDPNHPDALRLKEISGQLKTVASKLTELSYWHWPIIEMNIDPQMLTDYEVKGVREGFKIVVYN